MYSLKSWKFVQVLLSFTVEWLLRNNTLVQRKMLSFKRRCRSGQTRGANCCQAALESRIWSYTLVELWRCR